MHNIDQINKRKKIKVNKTKKVNKIYIYIYLQDDAKSKQKEKTKRVKIRKTYQKIEKSLRYELLKRHDWAVMKNYRARMKYIDEICLNDLQCNIFNFNICLKIVALKAF